MSPRLEFALDAVVRAGRLTLAHFQNHVAVERKADASPVTRADREAEQLIRDLIADRFPGEAVLGEEQGGSSAADRWIIDPIDGTKSFVCGVPLYSTLLSYEQDGQPVVGACYFPALGELLYAERGGGAFFNGRRCRVSSTDRLEDAVLCAGGHKHMVQLGRNEGLDRLAPRCLATRTWSDAYGHALVATGRVEAMIDPIVSRWDVSAMALIVQEAGGTVSRFDGSPALAPGLDDARLEFISSNGRLHETILAAFR